VKAEEKDEELRSLVPKPRLLMDVFADEDMSSGEIEISRTRANLASLLGIPLDAVEILAIDSMGVLEIRSAYIFLSASDIRKVINKGALS
jgi:hypothetical protein